MSKLVLNNFKRHTVDRWIDDLSSSGNSVYYLVATRSLVYAEGDDNFLPPGQSFKQMEIDPYQEAVFGKKISSSDVALMVDRYTWTSNTIYSKYSHTDTELFTKQFFVVHQDGATYNVYKCLDNNFESPSIYAPTDTDPTADSFQTADGYIWKFMYQMDDTTFEKFATDSHMPVYTNTAVASASVDGSISAIGITSNGSNYISSLDGTFSSIDIKVSNNTTYRLSPSASSNADFYTGSVIVITSGTGVGQYREIIDYTSDRVAVIDDLFDVTPDSTSDYIIRPKIVVTGDGTGALAYATVDTSTVNTIYPINGVVVVNTGSNYTYASAVVSGNTGSINAASNAAVLEIYIPPKNGHGSDCARELGCRRLGFSVTYNTDEGGFIPTVNDYRKILLMKDPLFDNVQLELSDEKGSTSAGETIYQFTYSRLHGEVSVSTSSNSFSNSIGVVTDFSNSVRVGDKIFLYDTTNSIQAIKTVTSVNSSVIQVDSNVGFACTNAKFAKADITASAVKTGYIGGTLYLTNATATFTTGRYIIGASSGATANVDAIYVGEPNKTYNNWNTFDARLRMYINNLNGTFSNDELITQGSTGANGYMHYANSSVIYLVNTKGTFNYGSIYTLAGADSSATANIQSVYTSDIVKGSGDCLYIEHSEPISRDPTQSETIRLVLEF